jgi:adenylate cyclase
MEGVHRPGDLPFRYGGEEFALILADTSLDGATGVAENIRKAIENLKISAEGSPLGPYVTMSFGVSNSGVDTLVSKEELVRSADEALYQAKKNGRNRVISN